MREEDCSYAVAVYLAALQSAYQEFVCMQIIAIVRLAISAAAFATKIWLRPCTTVGVSIRTYFYF